MGHFPSAETNADLHPVSVCQELLGCFNLGIEIVGVNAGAHTDLLDFHDPLVLLGFLLPLLLIETELGIVHDLAHRRYSVGRDLHQIHPLLLRHGVGLGCGNNPQLGAVCTNEPDLFVPDFLVELMV